MGKREENRADKRRRLCDAGRAAFLAEGWASASIERIATEADVARGTFYLYFPSKDALFAEVVGPLFDAIEGAVRDGRAELDRAADVEAAHEVYVATGLTVTFALLAREDLVRVYFAEARAPGWGGQYVRERMDVIEGLVAELLVEAVTRGLLRPHDARVVTLVMLGGIERVVWAWLEGSKGLDAASLPETITRLFREGLAPAPG